MIFKGEGDFAATTVSIETCWPEGWAYLRRNWFDHCTHVPDAHCGRPRRCPNGGQDVELLYGIQSTSQFEGAILHSRAGLGTRDQTSSVSMRS